MGSTLLKLFNKLQEASPLLLIASSVPLKLSLRTLQCLCGLPRLSQTVGNSRFLCLNIGATLPVQCLLVSEALGVSDFVGALFHTKQIHHAPHYSAPDRESFFLEFVPSYILHVSIYQDCKLGIRILEALLNAPAEVDNGKHEVFSNSYNALRVAHVAANIAGLKTPTKSTKSLPRKEGAELLTLSHQKVVTVYLKNASLPSSPATWRHGSLENEVS